MIPTQNHSLDFCPPVVVLQLAVLELALATEVVVGMAIVDVLKLALLKLALASEVVVGMAVDELRRWLGR